MKEANPIAFGHRVRERRKALGLSQDRLADLSGYSQTNIGHIELGRMKRPHIQAEAMSQALNTPVEYLLWGTGPKETGPRIMTSEEAAENYSLLSPEDRAAVTADISERLAAIKKKRRTG
jgi:transcriptional regulator with XRE-family HTH domain